MEPWRRSACSWPPIPGAVAGARGARPALLSYCSVPMFAWKHIRLAVHVPVPQQQHSSICWSHGCAQLGQGLMCGALTLAAPVWQGNAIAAAAWVVLWPGALVLSAPALLATHARRCRWGLECMHSACPVKARSSSGRSALHAPLETHRWMPSAGTGCWDRGAVGGSVWGRAEQRSRQKLVMVQHVPATSKGACSICSAGS